MKLELQCKLLCFQLTGIDFYTMPGGTSLEPLLLELRESREESARLREEIETIKVWVFPVSF